MPNNMISKILKYIGMGTIIIGIIASFIVGGSAGETIITIGGIIGSVISGILFLGFSEVINLLQQNVDNQEKIIRKLEEKIAPLVKDTATNKSKLQQDPVSQFINSTPKHLFRCEKCGKMIEKFPCIYCGNNPEN